MTPDDKGLAYLHPDTQAVLLLCGSFSRDEAREPRRLTLREYNGLADWLTSQGRRPGDLLHSPESFLPSGEPAIPDAERLRALLGRGMQLATALDHWHRLGLWIISSAEERYPERLRRQLGPAAPALLFGIGDQARLGQGGLAIVGSRDADEDALSFTRRVAERCAATEVQVVSGGARGVDQMAAAAALEADGGALVVLSDRLDRAATARDARDPLRRGKLTLVSPFEPESIFLVGRAMERNKVIYAFADAALVVRFAAGEGGTWNGAMEQLGRNKAGSASTPVYVRASGNPEDGCRQLYSRGALPFPVDGFWDNDIAEVLHPTATSAGLFEAESVAAASSAETPSTSGANSDREPTSPPNAAGAAEPVEPLVASPATPAVGPTPVSQADTCYRRCLPLILQYLREEPGERQLADIAQGLEVLPKQLKDWLKRAVEEGSVSKKKKKGRIVYTASVPSRDSTLFDRGGDAA